MTEDAQAPLQPKPLDRGIDDVAGEPGRDDQPRHDEGGKRTSEGWKSASNVIATVALLVSVVVAFITGLSERERGAEDAHSQLTDTLDRLSNIDAQAVQLSAANVPDEWKEFAGFGFANRKMVLLSRAEGLLKSVEERASAEDYAVLATGFFQIGDYAKAEELLDVYLNRAKDPIKRSIGLRSSAIMALAAGDSDTAYNLLNQALDAIGPPKSYAQRQAVLSIHLTRVQALIGDANFPAAQAAIRDFTEHAYTFPCATDRGQALARAQQLAAILAASGAINVQPDALVFDVKASPCPYDPGGPAVHAALSQGLTNPAQQPNLQQAELGELVGAYDFGGQRIEIIEWVDGQLASVALGQPTSRLLATSKADEFELEGFQGVVINAVRDPQGQVLRLDIKRPDGLFTATRL